MGNSNGEWGDYANDPVVAARWDTWAALPDLPDNHPPLDKWLERKGLTKADLYRLGTRWGSLNGRPALVYFFPDGLKYRTLDGKRGTEPGVTFDRFKFIKAALGPATEVIVAEGETDAALLSRLAPSCDIAVLPAGAKHVTDTMRAELERYDVTWVALDNDEAGNEGAKKLPGVRVVPPNGAVDWCDAYVAGHLGDGTSGTALDLSACLVAPPPGAVIEVFSVRQVLAADLGDYKDNHWFDNGILPVRGLMVLHGPMKSLKSFVSLELARALACGDTFAESYPFIRPVPHARVLLFQFEVSPFDFQRRLDVMTWDMNTALLDKFKDNFFTVGIADNTLPRVKVTDKDFRDTVLRYAEVAEADVVMFDPLQRMTGVANLDKSHELEPLMATFTALQDRGHTVVFTHHNNKDNKHGGDSYAGAGSQRISADADSICSMKWVKDVHRPDDNADGVKERNFDWNLRSGHAAPASVRTMPHPRDVREAKVEFGHAITASVPAPTTATTATAAASAGPPIS